MVGWVDGVPLARFGRASRQGWATRVDRLACAGPLSRTCLGSADGVVEEVSAAGLVVVSGVCALAEQDGDELGPVAK